MGNGEYDYLNNIKAPIELIGVPNILYPMAQFVSASRVNMYNHHLSQAMVLDNPEFPNLFTGIENNLIDYTFNKSRREHDMEIVAVIPKYDATILPMTIDDCPLFYVIGLTLEENGKRRLDYFEVSKYTMNSQKFGWLPILENRNRVRKGEILDKNTIITRSPAVMGDRYAMGTNLKVIYGSFPETIEDAFVISESAAKKLQTTEVCQTVINCRQDRRPLNLYGDGMSEKFLPDIGSYVREDGALCAFRPAHWTTIAADSDPEQLKEILHLQDDPYYIAPGSKIVDLTFNVNMKKMNNNCYPQAHLYMRSNNTCWHDIYETYLEYKNKPNVTLTAPMSVLVKTAIYRMIAQGHRMSSYVSDLGKVSKNFDIEGINRQEIDFMQVIVTHTRERFVNNGDKITDQAGAKGVVGKIYPDDWMPVDEFGERAELWIDMNSPVARNNPGQFYETYINRISTFVQRKVKEVSVTQNTEAAFNKLLEWYDDVNPNYAKRIRDCFVLPHHKAGIVKDAIESGPKIWIPPFLNTLTPTDDDFWNALRNTQNWGKKWGVKASRVKYKTLQADGTGKEFHTKAEFSIGSKYILHLHKIPEIFAPGPAAVNHIGVPTKSPYESKNFPVSRNPYRYGEDESRVIMMDSDPRELFRLQSMMSNSPTGVVTTIKTILLADNPVNIERVNISNGELAATNAILKLTHSITAALGVQTKSTRNDELTSQLKKMVEESNELTESIFHSDIIEESKNPISIFDDDDDKPSQSGPTPRKVKKRIEVSSIEDDED